MAADAILETLRTLWSILRENKAQAALAGGLALAVWKHPRATRDVDVLLLAEESLGALIGRLTKAGFKSRGSDPIPLGDTDLLRFEYEPPGAFVDRADAAALLRANHAVLDRERLALDADRLSLTADLEAVLKEALDD